MRKLAVNYNPNKYFIRDEPEHTEVDLRVVSEMIHNGELRYVYTKQRYKRMLDSNRLMQTRVESHRYYDRINHDA